MAINRYARRAHLSEAQVRRLARLFAFEIDATTTSRLTGISRRTVNRYYREFRTRIADATEREKANHREAAIDSAGIAVPPNPGPKAAARVFGIQVRHGYVRTEIVENTPDWRGQRVTEWSVRPDAATYDAIVLLSSSGRSRLVRCRTDEPARGRIDRAESFWSSTKSRLARRRGLDRRYLYLHLKECEFRFNYPRANVVRLLLDSMRVAPVK